MASKKKHTKSTLSKKTLHAVEDRPALVELVQLLAKGRLSARSIMTEVGCSKPTVYARIKMLDDLGVKVKKAKVREGASGPEADAFYL